MSEEGFYREQATEIVYQILRDLRGRGGFDSMWDSTDPGIQAEIVEEWGEITLGVLMRDA